MQFASIENLAIDFQFHSNEAGLMHFCGESSNDERDGCGRVAHLDLSPQFQCLFHAREGEPYNEWMLPSIYSLGLYPDAQRKPGRHRTRNQIFRVHTNQNCLAIVLSTNFVTENRSCLNFQRTHSHFAMNLSAASPLPMEK